MESDVSDIDASSYGHGERLNRPIEVLIIDRVFVVPDSGIGTCDFVADEENTVASRRWSRSGLDRIAHRRGGPGHNGRLLSMGGAYGTKTEWLVDSSYRELLGTKHCCTYCTGPGEPGTKCLRAERCIQLQQNRSPLRLASCLSHQR